MEPVVFDGQSKKDYEKVMITPQVIEASWERCRRNRINPALNKIPHISNKLDTKNLLDEAEFLLSVACSVIRDILYHNFVDKDQLVILCNSEGYVVYLISSPKTLGFCTDKNIVLGSCFREEVSGTNAIALAMRLQKVVVMNGEHHYCELFKGWSCIAKPIRLPCGDISGYLEVSMGSGEELGNTIALVQMTVEYIEEKMSAKKLLGKELPGTIIFPKKFARLDKISSREREILRLMAEGQSATEIAAAIGISSETVKTHREKLYKKLGVNKKSKCLEKAKQQGLLSE